MRTILKMLILTASYLSGGPAAAEELQNCTLVRLAALDMDIDAVGRVTVPMTMNGHDLKMVVDTGGFITAVTAETAQSLALAAKIIPMSRITLFNGDTINHYTTVEEIKLGNLHASRWDFLLMPQGDSLAGIGGILGPDVLRSYDVEFDFANAKLNLYSPDHCGGQVVYWTHDPYAAVPMQIDYSGHSLVEVQLDGKPVKALVDTGAWRTTMELEEAQDLFGEQFAKGLKHDANEEGASTYPFKSLTLEGVAVNNPDIVLISRERAKIFAKNWGEPKLIIGMGILRRLHLYIAYREKKLYLTPASAH